MHAFPGATHVTACECFAPVARSAAACLRANGMDTHVDLVHKASTEMVATDLQAARRADIIVNELYDTELLGEGVLPTLRHALEHLASPHCLVVPASADVIAVLLNANALAPGYDPSQLCTQGGTKLFPASGGGAEQGACAAGDGSIVPAWTTTYVSESLFVDKLIEKV
jgi:predicted RNA methylase